MRSHGLGVTAGFGTRHVTGMSQRWTHRSGLSAPFSPQDSSSHLSDDGNWLGTQDFGQLIRWDYFFDLALSLGFRKSFLNFLYSLDSGLPWGLLSTPFSCSPCSDSGCMRVCSCKVASAACWEDVQLSGVWRLDRGVWNNMCVSYPITSSPVSSFLPTPVCFLKSCQPRSSELQVRMSLCCPDQHCQTRCVLRSTCLVHLH